MRCLNLIPLLILSLSSLPTHAGIIATGGGSTIESSETGTKKWKLMTVELPFATYWRLNARLAVAALEMPLEVEILGRFVFIKRLGDSLVDCDETFEIVPESGN